MKIGYLKIILELKNYSSSSSNGLDLSRLKFLNLETDTEVSKGLLRLLLMNKNSKITVKEAQMDDEIKPGVALVAPGGYHLFLERKKPHKVVVRIDPEPSNLIHIPSIDITFADVAKVYKKRSLGIILTGMGKDGVEGLQKIKDYGGKSIAEDESTCVVYGMPEVAIQRGIVDKIAPVYNIAEIIMEMM